jgi:hypothetical protein
MAYDDGVKTAPIAYIGLLSVLVTFIIVMLLQVMYFGEEEGMRAADRAVEGPPAELADLTSRQTAHLMRKEVVDRQRGVVAIGISRAMELVVKELAAGKAPAEVAGPPLPAASPAAPATAPAAQQPPAGALETTPEPTPENKDATKS